MSKKREGEADRLMVRGFDGLYHPDPAAECGCFVGDLYPCGDRPKECRPGLAIECADFSGIYPARLVKAMKKCLTK